MNKTLLVILIILVTLVLTTIACTSQPEYTPRVIDTPIRAPSPAPTPTLAPTPTPPKAPSNLVATPSINKIDLRWLDNSNNEQGFKVYRDGSLIATLPSNTPAYQDVGLVPSTTYQYKVIAFNQTGESGTNVLSVKTPNPPIVVKLDRIGVYDNGEDFLRDADGGEVYLGIIITDGNNILKTRLPKNEGQFVNLYDNDTLDIGATIFSTNEVGDYLRIAVIGYESDGGPAEALVYQTLGLAAESYLSGGTATLLQMTDISLGNLIGKLSGEEDDWLGSFEKAWNSNDNWGAGNYSDVGCLKQDGTTGLRLWFTIETR